MALPTWLNRTLVALALFAGLLFVATFVRRTSGEAVRPPPVGLPRTPHYHSLLVDENDARHLWLGTHLGLYESRDGGRSWRVAGLAGRDVMNLARAKSGALWATGHNVAARSTDDGRTWVDVRPRGLPSLDIHGFAASRDVDGRLYAAVAGEGLFRSGDGGKTFARISAAVGPDVMGLAETLDGVLFAVDAEDGLLANANGDGKEWVEVLADPPAGIAPSLPVDQDLDAREHRRLLATTEDGVLVTSDKGATWRRTLSLDEGAGPVAWSPSAPTVAYAVGLDRRLYRSDDGGGSWKAVVE